MNTRVRNITYAIVGLVLILASVPIPVHRVEALADTPRWLNISTMEYNNVLFFDNDWDDENRYFQKGKGNNDCATYLDVDGFDINISGNDKDRIDAEITTVADLLTGDMEQAKKVDVYELKNSDPVNNICQYEHGDEIDAQDPGRANIWHYLNTDGKIYPFMNTGAGNELEFIQIYAPTTEDPSLYRATNRAQCPVEIEQNSTFANGLAAAPWKLRYPKEDQGAGCFEQGVFGSLLQQNPPPDVIPPAPTGPPGGESKPTCERDQGALGWILCPVAEKLLDSLKSLASGPVNDLLVTDLGPANDTNPTYKVWKGFQTIANILLVPAFLYVILRAASGGGGGRD